MSSEKVRAMVQIGPEEVELRDLPRPAIGPDEALVRIEACGVCGSDISMYRATGARKDDPDTFPVIRGHEAVGVIEEIGVDYAARTRLAIGDRVAVDPFLRCGSCRYCLGGKGELCSGGGRRISAYSSIPLSVGHGLWGGFASHLVASSRTILYPVPDSLPATKAALFNALGAGIKWTVDAGGATVGSRVLVLGCGQRGLASVIAARAAGAEWVGVTGLAADAHKLDVARQLGVDVALDVESQPLRKALAGNDIDIVIDTTPAATDAIGDAVQLVRVGGTIVVGGLKHRPVPEFGIDTVVMKEITLKGVLGTGAEHYQRAIALLATSPLPIELVQTHVLGLEQTERAIGLLAGDEPAERVINVVVAPTL
jgi:threonine dehydrogenase-like Zn-dependent dehydrogenase